MRVLFLNKTGNWRGGPYTWKDSLVAALKSEKGVFVDELETDARHAVAHFWKSMQKIRQADLVHVYVANWGTVFFQLAARALGKKVMYTCHGDFFTEWKSKKGWRGPDLFIRYRLMAGLATHWTFPSAFMAKKIARHMHTPHARVIFNGIAFDRVQKEKPASRKKTGVKKGERLFVVVTSFKYLEKCAPLSMLARAFARFSKTHPARLLILGEGMYKNRIERESKGTGVVFLGFQKSAHAYMKAADAVVHVTGLDNMPLNVLEAMGMEKPVLASDVGGIPEMSERIVRVPNSEHDIARGLEIIWRKRRVRYPGINRFSTRAMGSAFMDAYRRILAR